MPGIDTNKPTKLPRIFTANFIGGIAWALGMTIGFAILAYVLGRLLNTIGGLPVIGNYFANIIDSTQKALNNR
jgi:hypothetical protein